MARGATRTLQNRRLASGFCRLELWQQMPAVSLRPSVVSYNAAMSALRQGQRWPQCVQLFEEARIEAVEVDSIGFNTCCFARGKRSS